jgi:DNA-binding MarR family transcriptional regulator
VRRVADAADRRRVLVEAVSDRLTAGRTLFASPNRSLAQLLERYTARELAIIADFLARNAERLRTETGKLEGTAPARRTNPRSTSSPRRSAG